MLTEKQQQAYDTFSPWLRDGGNLLAKLKGYAGTGKTYLTQFVLNDARKIKVLKTTKDGLDEMVPFEICVTAPTHQAKKVIQRTTGVTGRTIQSLLGLAPNTDIDNFDINNPDFAVKNKPGMPNFDFIIIDEASTLNSGLLTLVKDTAYEFGVKVLFVFDNAQLPPVGEDGIPIDEDDTILISEELTEIIRTDKTNPSILTVTSIRNALEKTTDQFHHVSRISQDKTCGEVYIKSTIEFETRTVKRFWKLFQEGNVTSEKILAWSNRAVSNWNIRIRSSIRKLLKLEDRMSTYFVPGEPLVSFSTIDKTIITNSEEYTLTNFEFVERSWEYYERDENKKIINPETPKTITIEYIKGILQIFDSPGSTKEVYFVVPDLENYKKFSKLFFWYHSFGIIDRQWKKFFEWKEENLLLRDLKSAKGKMLCKKDFDYSYAVTIHKAQGSTYNNTYIDEADIDQLEDLSFVKFLYSQDLAKVKTKFAQAKFKRDYPSFNEYYKKCQNLKNRLKYVALTRASKFSVVHTKKG